MSPPALVKVNGVYYKKGGAMHNRLANKKQVAKVAKRVFNRNVEKNHSYLWQGASAAAPTITTFITTSNTAGNIWDLSKYAIPFTGTAPTAGRQGVRARLHAINIRAEITPNTGVTYNGVRFIVFRWGPTSGSLNPTEGALFAIPNATSVGNNALSFFTNNIKHEYTVLYDKHFTVGYQSDGGKIVDIKLHGKKLPAQTCFDATTSDDGTDHIYYAYISDLNATQFNVKTNIEIVWSDA